MNKFLRITLFLLILIVGIGSLAVYWTFYRPLPDYQSTQTHGTIQQQVNIHWDTHGVPHIYADNKHDLYYALGYTHAQDRLWQMTLSQMAAEGRFAEFLGKDLLPYDKLQRTLGFWDIAQQIAPTLSDSTQNLLQAYSAGINSYVKNNPKSLPIQFTLADMEPIPWTPTHSIALARMMAWELNLAWKSELNYAYFADTLSKDKFSQLLPDNRFLSSNSTNDSSWAQTLMPLVEKNENLNKIMGRRGSHVGSNAWAVSSEKSSTGAPLLAGDPHLGLNMPGKWYETHLNVNGRNLSGATLAGAPIVVLGQNDHLAWSLTNIMLDDTDFFVEAVNPKNANEYVIDSLANEAVYDEFEIQKEVIKIKGADDTLFTRKLTNHGPVISDVYPEQQYTKDRVISMQWTGYEVTNEIEALLTMNWAQSFEEFQKGAYNFKVPGQNFIYADKAGNIAQLSMANIPIRDENPILLREGWNTEHDWQGYVPDEQLPTIINPERGWVANANTFPANNNYPYYLSVYWEPGSRINRIEQYLTENEQLSPQLFQQMQNDTYSQFSRDLSKLILPVLKNSKQQQFEPAISYLENWDFSYGKSETAASIMDVFLLHLAENTFVDEMGETGYQNFVQFSSMPIRSLNRFLRNGSTFFDDVSTEDTTETRDDMIKKSMAEAIDFLQQNYGNEPFEWRWEQLHTITFKPQLFGEAAEDPDAPQALKLIVNNLLNNGPHPVSGHDMSINNGEYSWNDPYEMVLGPSIRRIIDFSDLSKTWTINPTGQSGNPLSQYYGDQTESWLNGQYKFLYQDSTFFDENQFKTMTFIPEDK
ncbi:penicillin acylase family protein [Fodinibius sp.]|uniref:penicillin acylase family protein n=1 Tax=Fodinibius sp. TaxID=1872440 RepID=UPI002ACDAF8A|nr:penicillin acylase family protein [Fodinibius sp.]MDZ7659682.1 penicillin acylase family protein [Fodinibius sp.]